MPRFVMGTANISAPPQAETESGLVVRGRKPSSMEEHLERVGEADGDLITPRLVVDHGDNGDLKWMNLVHSMEKM